ncbi:hypothetical protein ACSRUE_43530 [Sorangium sp. KYC3313]|uniref:hypothetical protein n=1 Tax=Sorangium sp. KYC3313 TaxID=3449740 RepID=UPI003F8CAB91
MEDVLSAMWLISPLGLAMIACVAIGFAVTAREALGRERGLREAREHAHDDEEAGLTDARDQAAGERDRYRRLLDCHVDAALAELTNVRARPIPGPGRVLESFCATDPSWRRKLAESTGLSPELAARSPGAKLPPPPVPRLRSPLPVRAGTGAELAGRAGTLTSFPLQRDEGGASAANASDWEESDWEEAARSPLNTTLPGVGSHG